MTKIRPTENTPRKPEQPGDRDHLEAACDETPPTRSPTITRFHRSRVCGNRPRTALAIGKKRRMLNHQHGLPKVPFFTFYLFFGNSC